MSNTYLNTYVDFYIKAFRRFDQNHIVVKFPWLKNIGNEKDSTTQKCIELLHEADIDVTIKECNTIEQCIPVEYTIGSDNQSHSFSIGSLPSLFELSQQTGLSALCLVTMRVVSSVICRKKIIYKAIVLDLDETLWNGILSEDGKEGIVQKLTSESGYPYIAFMKFIKSIAEELGIYIAICTRNDSSLVQSLLEEINEDVFPIKNQIDLVVSNTNDKSENIRSIAKYLSILPNAIVFIDDNQIVRDEVLSKIPEMYVPDWEHHNELITLLIVCCFFERNELSVNTKNRKKQFKIIQEERKNNTLPELYIRVHEDKEHTEAKKLYAKSNQFKLSKLDNNFNESTSSLFFEIFRPNGDSLGICSAITYYSCDNEFVILNWAISCRFFEIGLEEFILLYILKRKKHKTISFIFQTTDQNQKVIELIDKYYGKIIMDDSSSISNDSNVFLDYYPDNAIKPQLIVTRDEIGGFQLYDIYECTEGGINFVEENTKLKSYNG